MAIWSALFKKDFRLTRTIFFVGLVINLLILLLALVRGYIPIYTLVSWHCDSCFLSSDHVVYQLENRGRSARPLAA